MTNNSATDGHWRLLGKAMMLCLALCIGLVGCGGAGLAPVKGKVTVNGAPATQGNLTFSPIGGSSEDREAGKTASAEIQSDGTYTVATNKPGDGAKIGRHRINFTPAEQKLTEEQRKDPKYKAPPPLYLGMTVSPNEVEVKAGSNTIDLQLVPKGK